MKQIIPTILEKEYPAFSHKILKSLQYGNRIQIDVIEKNFADNQTILPNQWLMSFENINCDVHLMVENPMDWIAICLENKVSLITIHLEKLKEVKNFLQELREKKIRTGIAIDLDTDIFKVKVPLLNQFDQILLMAVKAGFAHQKFNSSVLEKINYVRQNCRKKAEIIIDGGINFDSAKQCFQARADGVAVNSYLWQNYPKNLFRLQRLAKLF
ncbi:hypothetical protein GYA19_01400 [Candidatus Beckwithbacteria bacterium]|nr:hypothetical protein [Candidatus Beckwithbacteria bacterium]